MAKKSNGNGTVTLARLYEILLQSELKNDAAHNEIKGELQKYRTDVVERMGELKERLVKIESQPAHENFQQRFCPNTTAIAELKELGSKSLREYILSHQSDHKSIGEKIDGVTEEIKDYKDKFELQMKTIVGIYEKKLDERDARARRAMWAGFLAIAAIAIPAIVEILLTIFG